MNKDALLATLIGFGIGLVFTGLLFLGPSLTKAFPRFSLPKLAFPTISFSKKASPPTPTPSPAELSVSIDSPLAENIETNDSVLVSGKTLTDAVVVVQGLSDEDVVRAKTGGVYAAKVSLIEGSNSIIVTAYKGGKQVSQTVTVFYTPEAF